MDNEEYMNYASVLAAGLMANNKDKNYTAEEAVELMENLARIMRDRQLQREEARGEWF